MSSDKTGANRKRIMKLLNEQGDVRAGEVAQLLELSAPGARKVLAQMVTDGLIEAHGERKGRYYSLPSQRS